MKVDVIESTERPERVVCQCARGDYYEGYVGDTEYAELMKDVSFDDSHVEGLPKIVFPYSKGTQMLAAASIDSYLDGGKDSLEEYIELEAKTRAFIEKQLSRGHYGPLEHPQITFSVKGVSRVTLAQITRHRHLTFDVQSMRYADFSEQEIVTPKSLLDDEHFSRETGLTDVEDRRELEQEYRDYVEDARSLYQHLVNKGVPKEDARFVLPLGTTVNLTMSGNIRTFLHLLDMRLKADAQWEIRELSEKLLDELFEWAPYSFNYYEEYGPNKLSP